MVRFRPMGFFFMVSITFVARIAMPLFFTMFGIMI
jgi:hypothetical protein